MLVVVSCDEFIVSSISLHYYTIDNISFIVTEA